MKCKWHWVRQLVRPPRAPGAVECAWALECEGLSSGPHSAPTGQATLGESQKILELPLPCRQNEDNKALSFTSMPWGSSGGGNCGNIMQIVFMGSPLLRVPVGFEHAPLCRSVLVCGGAEELGRERMRRPSLGLSFLVRLSSMAAWGANSRSTTNARRPIFQEFIILHTSVFPLIKWEQRKYLPHRVTVRISWDICHKVPKPHEHSVNFSSHCYLLRWRSPALSHVGGPGWGLHTLSSQSDLMPLGCLDAALFCHPTWYIVDWGLSCR